MFMGGEHLSLCWIVILVWMKDIIGKILGFVCGCLNFWTLVGYDTIPMLKLKATNKQEK